MASNGKLLPLDVTEGHVLSSFEDNPKGGRIDGKKMGPLRWGTLYGGVKMARDAAEYLEHPSTWAEHQGVREGIMKVGAEEGERQAVAE